MTWKSFATALTVSLVALGLFILSSSCTAPFWYNQTAERNGNVTVLVINNTPYRAAFTYGAWDALDLNPPGAIQTAQVLVEAQTSNAPITINCRRNFALGTRAMMDRVIATKADTATTFNPDAFDTTIHFSDAPVDSDLAALATVGTAQGTEKLLGVDFRCTDQLVFTFVQDPDAPGGFRVDFSVIRASESQ